MSLPVLGWSLVGAHDGFTWFLEVFPVLLGGPLLVWSAARFPVSSLVLAMMWVHGVILMVGGHYTYAMVPAGEWCKEWFGWTRNHYDKLGHFAQGFVPALIVRELLLRRSPLRADASGRTSRWLPVLVVCVCLAFSALYELFEWGTALATGSAADDFLGTQGDPWDTQTDMFMALLGSVIALVTLSGVHDRSMARIRGER
jgi:putative membrane protein